MIPTPQVLQCKGDMSFAQSALEEATPDPALIGGRMKTLREIRARMTLL